MNIGAATPEESGDFYAWGEIEAKETYSIAKYKYYDATTKTYTKLGNISKNSNYDIAYIFNKTLCIPTLEQTNELIENCKWEKITLDDNTVWRATGPNGKYIDFPLNGCKSESSKVSYTNYVYTWTSDELSNGSQAKTFRITTAPGTYSMYKRTGAAIRPVSSGEMEEENPTETKINFVDLGLSVNWADKNIGANTINDIGNFYSFAETETKDTYTIAKYKYYDAETKTYESLPTDVTKKFQYDIAYKTDNNMCLPTSDQINELITKCTWVKKENEWEVTGPNGNTIIIPINGCYAESSKRGYTGYTYLWSGTNTTSSQAKCLRIYSDNKPTVYQMYKRTGAGVRPVSVKTNTSRKTISPLIPYKFGQGAPWNNALPKDPADGKTVITGCINTSMTQIMLYYGLIGIDGKTWRRSLPGTKSFTTCPGTVNKQLMPALPPLEIDYDSINFYKSADFSKTKNPKGYEMIGKLMRQLGCINQSSYRSYNTTSSIRTSLLTYKNILHIGEDPKLILASQGIEKFENDIYEEIAKGYPVNMAGYNSKGQGGHAFICDGYNADSNKFHFNWGWNGNYDGWFSMTLLNAGTNDFSYQKQAIINIYPEKTSLDINEDNSVNITDVMVLVQNIIDKKLYDYKNDINNDGKVDEEDVSTLIDYILGKIK
jgi:hypothetical protein